MRLSGEKKWSEIGIPPRPDEALKSRDYGTAANAFAMEHFLQCRDSRAWISDGSMIGFGAALWLAEDPHGAIRIWARVCDEAIKGRFTHSSDGTFKGGLLLWFASVWMEKLEWKTDPPELRDNLTDDMHDLADTLLEKLLRKKRPIMGAGIAASIAKHLRGEIDLATVETEYSDVALFRERQQTMVMFYAGVRAFEHGNQQEALRLWSQVGTPKNSLIEIEYHLLVAERNRLGNEFKK